MSTIKHTITAHRKIIDICLSIQAKETALAALEPGTLEGYRSMTQKSIDNLYCDLIEAKKEAAKYDIEHEGVTGIIVERNDMVTMAEHFQFWPDSSF